MDKRIQQSISEPEIWAEFERGLLISSLLRGRQPILGPNRSKTPLKEEIDEAGIMNLTVQAARKARATRRGIFNRSEK